MTTGRARSLGNVERVTSIRCVRRSGVVVVALALLTVTACTAVVDAPQAGAPEGWATSSTDRRAIDQLGEIAPRGSGSSPAIDGAVTGVECWLPSEHPLEGTGFRVLCRVHYQQHDGDGDGASAAREHDAEHAAPERATAQRYRDMICIGDTAADPVSDGCYEWAYYTDAPAYEDEPGVFAAPID